MNNISTPLIESQVFDKLNVVFCYKTDTNINVMSTVSFEKFKLPTNRKGGATTYGITGFDSL